MSFILFNITWTSQNRLKKNLTQSREAAKKSQSFFRFSLRNLCVSAALRDFFLHIVQEMNFLDTNLLFFEFDAFYFFAA